MIDTEVWKKVEGFPNYSVSSYGKVRNDNTRKLLKAYDEGNGYFRVNLYNNGKEHGCLLHRLVAEAFLPQPSKQHEVNHKDGNKENNVVENLEWVTRSENHIHRCRTLNKINARKRAVICVETGIVYSSGSEASRSLGLCDDAVGHCLWGNNKTAGGYHWKYYEGDVKND